MSKQPAENPAKEDPVEDAAKQDVKQDTQQQQKPTEKRRPTDPIDYVDQLDIKLDGLKPIQNAAVVILLGGCTISETAGMIGVHRNTIHRWIKNVPAFRKGLHGAQNEQREAVLAQLDAMGRKAAGVVEQAIDKGNPSIALRLLKGIGLLGDQTATRNPYFKRQAKQSNNKKPDWGRKWQLPHLPRFGRSEVMASSILLLLASLLVVGVLNLAQAARTLGKSEPSALPPMLISEEGVTNTESQATNLQQDPKSAGRRPAGLSVSPVVINPAPPVVNQRTITITAQLAEMDNRLVFAEMVPAGVQHSATLCTHGAHRGRIPDG